MSDDLQSEVDSNYDFFQRRLSTYLAAHRGQYALIKSACLVDFFSAPGDAYRAGLDRFPDRIFSVQHVTDEPIDLGFMSLAFD